MPAAEDSASDLGLLIGAVRSAGELALGLLHRDLRRWSKPDGSQVTEADLAVNERLADTLRPHRPAYGWLSEESPDGPERLSCEDLWIVDPIDGTQDFIARGRDWCIAAALIHRGRPVAAAVYRPVGDELFTATENGPCELNGVPVCVADGPLLAGASIMGNRKSLQRLDGTGVEARTTRTLPLQLRLAFVAAGRLDGALSFGQRNDWDLAAGELLVQQAGGRVTDTDGRSLVYNRPQTWQQGLVAAGAKRHAAVLDALRKT